MAEVEEHLSSVRKIIGIYPKEARYLLAALQDIQAHERYLSVESMKAVADHLGVPESQVFSVATFYKALSLVPQGKKVIKVCTGTACHLRGAPGVVKAVEGLLGIKNCETTADGLFTIQTVNCVGACAMAPVVMVNEKVYGKLGQAEVSGMIESESKDETDK